MGDGHTDIHTDRVTNLGQFYSCSMQLKTVVGETYGPPTDTDPG